MRIGKLLFFTALFTSAPLTANARDWAEYTSDHFNVFSDAPEFDIAPLLREFEVFRLITLAMLNLPNIDEDERLLIFVFDRTSDFDRLKPRGAAGYFYNSVSGPRMIIGPGDRRDTRETLFHEYVHYIMNRHSPMNYPAWYSEGMATLLQSAQIYPTGIHVGAPPEYFRVIIERNAHASVNEIIDTRSRRSILNFYPTAWLLTHYLMLNRSDTETTRRQTRDYLIRYDAGGDPVETFVESFGIDPSGMHRQLRRYTRRQTIGGMRSDPIEYQGELSRRVLNEDEQLYRLGDLAVERGRHSTAHDYFDEFEETSAASSYAANVKLRRAIALIHEDRAEEGDTIFNEMTASGSSRADVATDIAHYAFDRYIYELDHAGTPDRTLLSRAIELGERAAGENPADLEALLYLGRSYELNDNLQQAVDTLINAYEINPSIPVLNQSLARVLIRGRQLELASFLVARLYSASHSEEDREKYSAIQSAIESGNIDIQTLASML